MSPGCSKRSFWGATIATSGRVTEKYLPLMRKAGESPDLVGVLYYQGAFDLSLESSKRIYQGQHRLMAEAHAISRTVEAGQNMSLRQVWLTAY